MTELALVLAVLLVGFIFLRVEIGFALGFVGVLGLILGGYPLVVFASRPFSGINQFVLVSVPFFLLAAELMNNSGITSRLVTTANLTVGRFRGGLAHANIAASLLFGGISGAAVADVAAIGSIFIPSMEAEGYERSFSAAVTAISSLIGPIIPPSIIIVIYGSLTQTSIGGLFAAAIFPGIGMAVVLMIGVFLMATLNDYPRYDADVDRSEYPRLLLDSILALTMPAIIIFGIVGGYFTATEAAVIASVYAMFIGVVIYRSLSRDGINEAFRNSVMRTSQIFVIIAFAAIFSWVLARERVPQLLLEVLRDFGLGPIGFMITIAVVLLFIGTWLNATPALVMLAPTLADMAFALGIHPFQFGIFLTFTLLTGLVTPPLGIILFVASSVGQIPVEDIVRKIIPFYSMNIVMILMLIFIPELTLFIPRQLGYL